MWVGAAVSLVGGLIVLLTVDVEAVVDETRAGWGGTLSLDRETTMTVAYVAILVSLVLGTALWVWMAIMNDKGKKWARIVATVFFGIAVLSAITTLMGSTPTPTLSKVLSVVNLLVGLGAIILMYRPESSRYYEQQSARRY